ncbi:MAG: indolepyruvate oxidoreductase subunit beta [Armatimonadetes bacterium]|nr:indolepyruvate oxidoreductase subunit beta [Armatimonadota bacterium]
MKQDLIIAGVGGQGILTIARVLSMAAVAKGLHVKQAEVHGMSQRGGAVYSHLRISDADIYSDLIPEGSADMILAIEPLEALRYVSMLRADGSIVTSTNAEVNVPDYPAIEQVLGHVAGFDRHIAIDTDKLARAAGGVLAANIVALGAASVYLGFTVQELQDALEVLFAPKGERIVQTNVRALRFGRSAAIAYREALARNVAPSDARGWISQLSAEHLAAEDMDFDELVPLGDTARLTGAEAHAFESLLMNAYDEGRSQLYEHEVYRLIELVGAISPPRHTFVPVGSAMDEEVLLGFPGEKVVLKLVSTEVVHKSDAGGVAIVPKDIARVRVEADRMIARHAEGGHVAGILAVEFVDHDSRGLGGELFVGIRATREFGPVVAAGLGGVQTEYLAAKMRPGIAVAKAVALDTGAEEFLDMFRQTVAYDVLSGRIRGQERSVSDGELLRCFRAFISIARRFCVDRGEEGPDIGELEVNPFAFSGQRMIPLDGRGNLRTAARPRTARPRENVRALLEPKSIAVAGVSSKPDSFGRVILSNIVGTGFDPAAVTVVRPDGGPFDGFPTVGSVDSLTGETDLLVVAVPAASVPGVVASAVRSGRVRSGIVISGGAGETEGSEEIGHALAGAISEGRSSADGGPVFLGPNCMGVRSLPGRYDTFFVPFDRMPDRSKVAPQPVALLSQSGAFVVSRLSAQSHSNPRFAVSIGNQCDLTVADFLWAFAERDDVQVVGVYLEGFADLDGLDALRAVTELTSQGKSVVFYKAGRTESGRKAAEGHTAAVAGDYEICQTAMEAAGAFVARDFREFGQAMDLATSLAGKELREGRLFAVTNAGMEAVAMADACPGIQPPGQDLTGRITDVLRAKRLDVLVQARNPLDLTPAADEKVYDDVVRAALGDPGTDAVVVSCVPLAPGLHTLEYQLGDDVAFPALAREWLRMSDKPILFAIDGGAAYDALAASLQSLGLCVFRSADEAARLWGRWMDLIGVRRVVSSTAAPGVEQESVALV